MTHPPFLATLGTVIEAERIDEDGKSYALVDGERIRINARCVRTAGICSYYVAGDIVYVLRYKTAKPRQAKSSVRRGKHTPTTIADIRRHIAEGSQGCARQMAERYNLSVGAISGIVKLTSYAYVETEWDGIVSGRLKHRRR